jgi:dTDP-4-amino-4,6-dideoxygalactose transaminase
LNEINMSATPYQIPYNMAYRSGRELTYIADCYARRHISGDGFHTKWCRDVLSAHYGTQVLLTQSCTAALEMAVTLLDIGPGDEVIMPSYAFSSAATAIARTGAKAVFVDCDPQTMNIDPTELEAARSERTAAVMIIHYAGVGCDMDHILSFCQRHRLALIEDAAQAQGSTWRGQLLGTFGALGALSFHETKNISCGEGGALIINRADLLERAEIIREKGTNRARYFKGLVDKYTWVDIGSSYLPSDILAAVLHAQMDEYETISTRRMALWNSYNRALRPLAGPETFAVPHIPETCVHNGHIYYLIMPTAERRDHFISFMRMRGIMTPFHYVPLHSAPAAAIFGRSSGNLPVTTDYSARLIRLPLYLGLEEHQPRVVDAIAEWLASAEERVH